MKKTLILSLMLLSIMAVQAQTIHWLLFIDTTDPNVGEVDKYGREMLRNYFISEVNAVLKHEGYKTDIKDIYGTQVSPETCKRVINNLKADPNDIIVFYYIGHGGRPVGDAEYRRNHPFPQMCMAQHDPEKFVPLEWVDEELSNKGARLAVTIAMCCNSYSDNITIKDEPTFSPNYGATNLSTNKIARIKDLFLNHEGHLIATSSSPGQVSSAIPIRISGIPNNPADYRDAYSYAICDFFQTQIDKYNSTMTWEDFLTAIKNYIDRNSNHKQTPIHDTKDVAMTHRKKPIPKPNPKPEPKTPSDLSNTLSALIDTSRSIQERQKLEMKLENDVFAKNAMVKFLGQESENVIDKSRVEDWLGILATNPQNRIYNVEVIDQETDSNGKIKTIRVKETYKK